MAWAQLWRATRGRTPDLNEMGIWPSVQWNLGITPDQAFIISLIGLLLGMLLTIPWWHERLQRESVCWEKQDKPLDTPPRGGV
jgi:hypothetical protein